MTGRSPRTAPIDQLFDQRTAVMEAEMVMVCSWKRSREPRHKVDSFIIGVKSECDGECWAATQSGDNRTPIPVCACATRRELEAARHEWPLTSWGRPGPICS